MQDFLIVVVLVGSGFELFECEFQHVQFPEYIIHGDLVGEEHLVVSLLEAVVNLG